MPHLDAIPEGAQALGTAMASCRAEFPKGVHFVSRLGNLDCSPGRLVEVVEEIAGEVGGGSLWQLDCRRSGAPEEPLPPAQSHAFLGAESYRSAVPGERLECTAVVLGTREAATASPKSTATRKRQRANAILQFDAATAAPLPSPSPQQVAVEVPYLPVADRSLGILRLSMGPGTEEHDVRAAMSEAAGRLGATHVVIPTCWESLQPCGKVTSVVCQAIVSTTLLDPRVTLGAR